MTGGRRGLGESAAASLAGAASPKRRLRQVNNSVDAVHTRRAPDSRASPAGPGENDLRVGAEVVRPILTGKQKRIGATVNEQQREPRPLRTDVKAMREKLVAAGVRPTRQRLELGLLIFAPGDRHFTAETIYNEARAMRYPPSLGTIYNTLNEFARCGLLREIAIYDAKLWYDTKIGPHYHFYWEDSEELWDIPEELLPRFDIPAPEGARVEAIDVIVRLKSE
jgi:Fur family iron response transcriptional regulator